MKYRNHIPEYSLGGVLSSSFAGAKTLSGLGLPGIIGGGALGLVKGIVDQNEQEKQRIAQEMSVVNQMTKSNNIARRTNDARKVDAYGIDGIDYNFYAKGGEIRPSQYEVEGGEVVQGQGVALENQQQLSSDMTLAKGASHKNGGVQGVGGERVFTDQIEVDSSIRFLLDSLGLGKIKGKTYAEVSEDLGKKKGKFEKKLSSNFQPSKNTANQMIERIDNTVDLLFDAQEASKPQPKETEEFALGGYINPLTPTFETTKNLPTITPISNVGNFTPINIKTPISETVGNVVNSVGKRVGSTDGIGQALNLFNYFGNQNDIDSLNTNVDRKLYSVPQYNYRDMSENANREIGRSVSQALDTLESTSASVNASNVGNIVARGIDAKNQIALGEMQNKLNYDNNYDARVDGINNANVDIANQAADEKRNLQNQQIMASQQNRTALVKGVMGNIDNNNRRKTDRTKMTLSALINDENGVMSRVAKGYNTDVTGLIDLIYKNRI